MLDRIDRADGRPPLIHRTSGKDRTGFGAALILLALGAACEVVPRDRALTNQYWHDVSFLFSPPDAAGGGGRADRGAPKYLEAALERIDRSFASMDDYLERALGLTEARRTRLRAVLTQGG